MRQDPIHLLQGIRQLTPQSLEIALAQQQKEYFVAGRFKDEARQNGLFLDLSQVRWVNLSAATQLVLFIERARKGDIPVYIAFPLKRLTQRELDNTEHDDNQKEEWRRAREEANTFLKVIQFDKAVMCSHIQTTAVIAITDDFEFSKEAVKLERLRQAFQSTYVRQEANHDYRRYKYKYLFPITWIDTEQKSLLMDDFEKKFQEVLSQPERGLSNIDILSLKNVVLSELMKNVREHAGSETRYAVISIGLMPRATLINEKKGKLSYNGSSQEQDFLKWIYNNRIENIIEINFGDSGDGIIGDELVVSAQVHFPDNNGISRIDKLQVLEWAFDKWSSRKKEEVLRGTKGLYRINRIVNKYNGIVLIRTGELHGGFQKGGYSSAKWIADETQAVYDHPGTFVQIKLCPYKEISQFDFSFERRQSHRKWAFRHFHVSNDTVGKFEQWLGENLPLKSDLNVLLIFQASSKNLLDIEELKDFYTRSLRYLSLLRHPNGMVVYIADDIGSELLQEIAESTNQLILKENGSAHLPEAATPDQEDVFDPVLLLEKGNSMSWFGGNQKIINILNELFSTPGVRNLLELPIYANLNKEDKDAIRFHFQNDDSLVTVTKDFAVEFNFTNIPELFSNELRSVFNNLGKDRGRICTPKLRIVSQWHKLNEILKPASIVGYSLAMYLKVRERFKDLRISPKTHILVDHDQQWELTLEFAKLFGITKRNIVSIVDDIDNNIPRRTPLFNSGDDVIVLTTIISSSETIRRLVKYIKRDLGNPVCIVCLANLRDTNVMYLQTWGALTPILSIYQKNDVGEGQEAQYKGDKKEKGADYFRKVYEQLNAATEVVSPNYDDVSVIDRNLIGDKNFLPEELKRYIVEVKALYYSHIGNFNGRHFTFYIDKRKILSNYSFIWEAYERAILEWISAFGNRKVILIRPEFQKEDGQPLENIASYLTKRNPNIIAETWSVEKPRKIQGANIIYIDFGALTGQSISRFLACCQGAENILLCILFSQFTKGEDSFYAHIRTMTFEDVGLKTAEQPTLFPIDIPVRSRSTRREAKVDIQFLYKLPADFYRSSDCPICEHERALELFQMQGDYMLSFSVDRKKRLKIREKADIFPYPCDFYATPEDDQFELSSDLIMEMYELKVLLERALTNTESRILVFNYVYDIFSKLGDQIQNPTSNLYAFLFLISHEVIWLQKEPLVFRDMRLMIAHFAAEVSKRKLKEFSEDFQSRNEVNTSPLRLAVRYKYAAVTVLRSSNKLQFCQVIADVVASSVHENHISDNILQNLFYHIHSLQSNRYNKSVDYFSLLDQQIDEILNSGLKLSVFQHVTLSRINMTNKRIWNKIAAEALDNDYRVFVELKKKVFEQYKKDNNHPDPIEHFSQLDFSQLQAYIPDLEQNKEGSTFFRNFQDIQKSMIEDLDIVASYLENIVYMHFEMFSDKILESKLFRTIQLPDITIRRSGDRSFLSDFDRFTELVYQIHYDLGKLPMNIQEYKRLFSSVNTRFVTAKGIRGEKQDCTLLKLLKSIPSDLEEVVLDNFRKADFRKFHNNFPGDQSCRVFYPHTQLLKHMRLIKENIIKRLNPGLTLKDVDISFLISNEMAKENNYVILEIKYSSTDQWKGVTNNRGALNEFNNELERFGGGLTYNLQGTSGFFVITM